LLYELVVAFAVGFIAGMIYESERISKLVSTERGLKQFLLLRAPWHLRKIEPMKTKKVQFRSESRLSFMIKIIILAGIILMILSANGLF